MNNVVLAGIIGTVVVAGVVGAALVVRRNNIQRSIEDATETIEGDLQFADVRSYLRSLNLKEGEDTPFIGNGNAPQFAQSPQFAQITKGYLKAKPGYQLLIIGTYSENPDKVDNFKFIFSKGWSEDLKKVIGDEAIVVLS